MSTVLLVDHLPIVRDGLRFILERAGHQVLGEVDNGQDALEQCRLLHPELVIIELLIPRLGGLDLLRRLRASHEDIRLLVFSVQEASLYAARSMQAGADAYVCKTEKLVQLHNALQAVSHGRSYFPRELTHREAQKTHAKSESELTQLSGRELTVLQMLSQGQNNNDIAKQLSLSYKTISTYKARLHQKLNVGNDFQLVEVARSHGLVAGGDSARPIQPPADPHLLREHGLLRALLDSAPYPMFVRDVEGRLLMCNRRYQDYTGEGFEHIRGSTLEQALWLTPATRKRSQLRFREAVMREEPFMAEVVVELRGVATAMQVWCTPFRDEAGQVVVMLGGMRDLTERDRMLSTLRHESAKAHFESHLKSSALAAVSEELQAVLIAIPGSVVQASPAGQGSLAQTLAAMGQCLARVDALIALDANERGTHNQVHNLGSLTESILAPLQHCLQAQGCELNLGPGLRALKSAWIDAHYYRQLLETLFNYLSLGSLPPLVCLYLATSIQPRGLLRLSVELSPWHLPSDSDLPAVWAYASIQSLLLRLQASAQVVASNNGDTLLWRMELDLPEALST